MCLYPRLIKNRKYIANKKNGGNIPPVTDLRVLMVPVGCGKCIECKKQKSREGSIRLQEEIRHMKNNEWKTEIENKCRERGLDQEDTKILLDGIETALGVYKN